MLQLPPFWWHKSNKNSNGFNTFNQCKHFIEIYPVVVNNLLQRVLLLWKQFLPPLLWPSSFQLNKFLPPLLWPILDYFGPHDGLKVHHHLKIEVIVCSRLENLFHSHHISVVLEWSYLTFVMEELHGLHDHRVLELYWKRLVVLLYFHFHHFMLLFVHHYQGLFRLL